MTTQALYSFRTKVIRYEIFGQPGTFTPATVSVPKVCRNHVDMAAMRQHKRYGSYANSDLFLSMIARDMKRAGIGIRLELDNLPAGVTVDTSGFLAAVTIDLDAALAAAGA